MSAEEWRPITGCPNYEATHRWSRARRAQAA